VRVGDRWQCNRSALRGGECDDGPTPDGACRRVHRCRPVRSLRAIRGRFLTACTLLTVGGLIILLSADWRDQVLSPGPLSSQHAQLLAANSTQPNCAACHGAADRSVAGWSASLIGINGSGKTQSQRCMDCHDKSIATEHALAAHSVSSELLRRITEPADKAPADEIACATCHREHRGGQFDLTAMDNAACQACHQQRYESFATDHPDFGDWPYERRTRIVFNHASHSAKHFAEKKQTFDCRMCHLDDASGAVQLTAGYEAACASCHDEKIATSVAGGVPILSLPTIDVEVLKAAGFDIGTWPDAATGDFDGRLSPMMKLLLTGDPDAAKAMKTLGADFEFFDIDPEDARQLEACAALAESIKRLIGELSSDEQAVAHKRLRAAVGYDASNGQLNALLSGLSTEIVRSAAESWFPERGNLSTHSSDGQPVGGADMSTPHSGDKNPRKPGGPVAFDPAGNWIRNDADFSIRYRPASHADPVLAGWLELLAAIPDVAQRPVATAMFKELSSPTAPGQCASCHSVERSADGSIVINWRAYDRTTAGRTLTKFAHGPHLILPQLADCTHCHAIDESQSVAVWYANDDPQQFVSEFAPLSKRDCASCHTAKAAGDACQQCHNYHVDGIENWRWSTTAE
jgi:hypothetical protein